MVYYTRVDPNQSLPIVYARHSTCSVVVGLGMGPDGPWFLLAHFESTITERNLQSFMDTLSRNHVKWDLYLLGGMRKRHGAEVPIDRDGILDFVNGTLNGCLREGTKVDELALAEFKHRQQGLMKMDAGFHFTVLQLIIELAERSGGPGCCVQAVTPVSPTFLALGMQKHWLHFFVLTVDAAGIPCLQVMEVQPQKDGADGIPEGAYTPTNPASDAVDSQRSANLVRERMVEGSNMEELHDEHMARPLFELDEFIPELGPGAHEVVMNRLEGLVDAMQEGPFKRTMETRCAMLRMNGGPRCVAWEDLVKAAVDCRTYTLDWSVRT
jgi:hypothetical protein